MLLSTEVLTIAQKYPQQLRTSFLIRLTTSGPYTVYCMNFNLAFEKFHSTDTCLLCLSDYIRSEVDKGNFCGMAMLDLQNAFDEVDRGILLSKLKAIIFNDVAVRWISSYLKDKKQMVDVGGTMSHPRSIDCGVPQGSVLGPIFFL